MSTSDIELGEHGGEHRHTGVFDMSCINRGLGRLEPGKHLPGDKFHDVHQEKYPSTSISKPDWYDHGKFLRGQKFFQNNILSIVLSMKVSLVAGMSLPSLIKPLLFTKASDTPEKALSRYLMTFYHILLWFTEDIWDTNSAAHKSFKIIRSMHRNTAEKMKKKFDSPNEEIISQYDMAVVQSGFFAGVILYPDHYGIRYSKTDLDSYVHAWRTIAHLLGVEDRFNICCDTLEETQLICKEIRDELVCPNLRNPPEGFEMLADAFLNGLNSIHNIKLFSTPSILATIYYIFNEPRSFSLSITDTLRLWMLRLMFSLLYYSDMFNNFVNSRTLKIAMTFFKSRLHNKFEQQAKTYMH